MLYCLYEKCKCMYLRRPLLAHQQSEEKMSNDIALRFSVPRPAPFLSDQIRFMLIGQVCGHTPEI